MFIDYDDEMLQQINAEADLYAYVSETMELERKGPDYFAKCPMHIDNTPSLCFTPEKNSYYCFSCGRSGGFIGYLMEYEGLRIDEAVDKAAKIAGIDPSSMCHSQTIKFLKRIQSVFKQTKCKYEHEILDESKYEKYNQQLPQEWIDEGIEPDVMRLFDIRIDELKNRIVYPVRDISGRLLNVKARTRYKNYKELKIPKYINYYQIGVLDYFQGLDITLRYVQEQNEIIIFESVKSVMKAYGWGYKNCASAEKHTLTDEQVELLVRLKCNVVLAYDSDVSYRDRSVKRSIDKLRRITNVYVIDDPDKLLGGSSAKNAPVDCGLEVWKELYFGKRKVV